MISETESILDALNAAADNERHKLNFFGYDNDDLERQVIVYVLEHARQSFMQKLLPHINYELFDCGAGYVIMKVIHDHWEEYGNIPGRGQILHVIAQVLTENDKTRYQEFITWLDTRQDPAVFTYLTGKFIDDLRAKAYQHAADKSHELARDRDYENLDRLFHTCFPEPEADTRSLNFKEDLDLILAEDVIQSIPLGFPRLDSHLHNSGPARGEVLVWLANTGVGKTTMLLNCARHIERHGHTVLYVALEGTNKAIAQRLASIYSNAPTKTVHDHQVLTRREVMAGQGQVRFIQPQDQVWTARHIGKKMEFLKITEGFVPDVIVVDYAKLLRAGGVSKQDSEYIKIARVMDEVKRLALDTNALVLTAQQANRDGESADMVGLKHAAGSYDALQPVDYVVSINQTMLEERQGSIRLIINKNRHGPESVVIQCQVNRVSGRVQER